MAKGKQDSLGSDWEKFKGTIYKPGHSYCWVMGFGWCIVGFYIEHLSPLTIRVAHANHFRNANKDYGKLMQEGAGKECEWRYEGNEELTVPAIQRVGEYLGEVPRGNIRAS